MAILGAIESVRAQAPQTGGFAAAWKYIDELLRPASAAHRRILALRRGDSNRQELGAGVFALEQAYETKSRSDGFFESHRKFIDVQVVVEGSETMECGDIRRAEVRKGYDANKDLIVYGDLHGACQLRIAAGEAVVFFPDDVHMPSLSAGAGPGFVRKSVLKLPFPA